MVLDGGENQMGSQVTECLPIQAQKAIAGDDDSELGSIKLE